MTEITPSLDSFNKTEETPTNESSEPKNNSPIQKPKQTTTAHELAKKQRDISISEFFEKNRHLLGFDNKRKALLTTVKEAVDNALDACDESGILPELEITMVDMGNDRFKISIEDNGPGIVKAQIPKIFAKLLYGSKFHSLKQNRGQQGIGISASVMYGQLTTGKAARIISKIHPNEPAHYYELTIDTQKNKPKIVKEETKEWYKEHGTRIEIDLEGSYLKGNQSVDEYLKQTAIINPHATITYVNPKSEQIMFPRATDELPKQSAEIKPHPYGIELGMLIKMLEWSECKTVKKFLQTEFSRVSSRNADDILERSAIISNTKPNKVNREMAERIMEAIKKTKLMAPPTDCISPIGSNLLEKGLRKEVNAEFYTSITRPPSVYRGNPFVIEAALAYGGLIPKEGSIQVLRYANKVPLLYQQGACAVTQSIAKTSWRSYGLTQSGSNLPQGPVVILVHIASVWVPFTSEAKEAIAHYPEIIKEVKLALQEIGRNLYRYVAKKRKVHDEMKKRSYIESYIPHVSSALKEILEFSDIEEQNITELLEKLLEKHRGEIDEMEFDKNKNTDYDEDFAKIGKEEKSEDDEDLDNEDSDEEQDE
jgi:DNA topoisomerase VI subunit B